ncbi:MAG: heavy-metal-associated domain-containing protein [Candidatus Rokubacteria bacterium]|nr:heavy-metal-associated domain-containing protein [Candidatus Rokubacteria bacterium]MBI2878628.1 heavy-metal-associated domain-containing protein [Candidatus Rokubacteria bacterium]
MAKTRTLAVVLALAALASAAGAGAAERLVLKVDGMVCPACERAVESVLRSQPGVLEARASFRTGRATVLYDPERVTPEEIAEAINTRTFYRARILGPGEGAAARPPAR